MVNRRAKEEEVATKMEPAFDEDYQYNKLKFASYDDGAVSLSETQGGESWIYLYPDQVEALKVFLLPDKERESLEQFKSALLTSTNEELLREHKYLKANAKFIKVGRIVLMDVELRKRGLIK